ncbi:MAG: DUF177 domain-containing protein [Bacteroidetes bacterium]|nr:DUF177 domain-containing protein [Bacteroidota bacterium]MCH8524918.1 DUF177 domain-containing protein [Balneolales bacterium]
MAKLQFKINEIPKGKSATQLKLTTEDLGIDSMEYRDLMLRVEFEKREALITVSFQISGEALLVCDRSLDTFWSEIDAEYTILFKESADFESEDDKTAVRRLDISGNIIKIDTEVRDTVMLSLPARRIHPRYFDESGELKEFENIKEEREVTDPRWEALRALKENPSNN